MLSVEPFVHMQNVSKRYGRHLALDGINLALRPGSVTGLLGPNGAGKTTTLRLLTGILQPDAGQIQVLGGAATDQRHRVGYLPEEKGLYRRMKVLDLVTFFGRLKGMPRRTARARARHWLEQLELSDRLHVRCDTLSKGLGQKVQIAATLLHEPDLVILDEPFSGLDPINVDLVTRTVRTLCADGRCILFSTHVMSQAQQLCDDICLLQSGKTVLQGPLEQLQAAASNVIVIRYTGATALPGIAGAETLSDDGKTATLRPFDAGDPTPILRDLLARNPHLRVQHFELKAPSLHELFVRATEPGAQQHPEVA